MGGRMARGWWLVLAALVVVIVVEVIYLNLPTGPAAPATASAIPSSGIVPNPSGTATPTAAASPSPTPTPASTAPPDATPSPPPTDPPTATGDPRLLYAEFLLRVDDDRSTVARLNQTLGDAAQVPNLKQVKSAAVDILDFVDTERDWLAGHPPADCYATAHRDARRMLSAYGSAAEAFIAWAGTGGGLTGAGALLDALDAADRAGQALATFGATLEATRCPA